MPRLELEQDVKNVKRFLNKKAIGFLAAGSILVAIPIIGTTLAGTIQINSGNAVQFAQGSITTATCDADISISATSTYSDNFYLKTITLSGINLVSGCEGKTLTVSAATTASPSIPGTISSGVTDISFTIPLTVGASSTLVTGLTSGITATAGMVNGSAVAYKTGVAYDAYGSITLTVTTPTLLTSTVSKFLIQASS